MEIIIYGLIFIMGTVFGSFFTLAVYRIPLGENIVYKHSFCPNCKAKLKFKDLIPVLSYIFLGGRCAYCGEKIRIRYLLLEILSGIVFLLFALSLKVDMYNLSNYVIIYFAFYILYIASLFIIAGIDKENIKIQTELLVFGLILSLCYMTYVCIVNTQEIYTYIIYLILTVLLLLSDTIFYKNKLKQSYTIRILMLLLYVLVFSGSILTYYTIILTFLLISIKIIFDKIKNRARNKSVINTEDKIKIPFGFYIAVSNIIVIIINNFLSNWVI